MEEEIRNYAFRWLTDQTKIHGEVLPRKLLETGFIYQNQRVTLVGPSGIWKPKVFDKIPISITSIPGGPYEDKFSADGLLIYRYRGQDPDHRDNVGLREAMRTRTPLVYFHGIIEGRYLPVWPVFIMQNSPEELFCTVAVDPAFALGTSALEDIGLQGSKEGNIIEVKGTDEFWTRNSVKKQFVAQGSFNNPYSRVTKGNQSISFAIPTGSFGSSTIADLGVMLLKWALGIQYTEPNSSSSIIFAIMINQPREKMEELKEALGID